MAPHIYFRHHIGKNSDLILSIISESDLSCISICHLVNKWNRSSNNNHALVAYVQTLVFPLVNQTDII
jgi:hypothetical protein